MASFPTPTYKHLRGADFEKIYEPAEDSFLLMDALEKECDLIRKIKPLICLEIGPGSGVVITFLAKIIGHHCFYIASDINSYAAHATRDTALENNVTVECTVDSLILSLARRLEETVDIVLFNPPYVVTPSEEMFDRVVKASSEQVGGNSIEASWAGGQYGREVIDKVLPIIPKILSKHGLFYLLLLEENKPDEVINIMKQYGFTHSVIVRRKTGPESLMVIRFSRTEVT